MGGSLAVCGDRTLGINPANIRQPSSPTRIDWGAHSQSKHEHRLVGTPKSIRTIIKELKSLLIFERDMLIVE